MFVLCLLIVFTDPQIAQYSSIAVVGTLKLRSSKKRLLHPGIKYLFGDYLYSIWLWGLKAVWLAEFMLCLCLVSTILNVYFGKFLMISIDIGEIGCIPKGY